MVRHIDFRSIRIYCLFCGRIFSADPGIDLWPPGILSYGMLDGSVYAGRTMDTTKDSQSSSALSHRTFGLYFLSGVYETLSDEFTGHGTCKKRKHQGYGLYPVLCVCGQLPKENYHPETEIKGAVTNKQPYE